MKPDSLKPMGIGVSLAVYVPAMILLLVMTRCAIPFLAKTTGMETIFFWFLVGGLGVFLPLIIAAVLILRAEGRSLDKKTWKDRLRFRRLTAKDIAWAAGGLAASGVASGLVMAGLAGVTGSFDHTPVFMSFEPLTSGRYWLLAVWVPYWILNILGEEILWRGVMLPRQEAAFGKWAWVVHGAGWGLFHVAFGWQLLLTLAPLLFILSYAVQKTKNSWVGVILHGGLNGPSFIAIALGLM